MSAWKNSGGWTNTSKNSPRSLVPKKYPFDWATPDQRCRAAIKAVGKYGQVIPLNRGVKQPQK